MNIPVINGQELYNMLVGGYRNLKRHMSAIDELNVFPVPDGDTGKNMTATLEGGAVNADATQNSVQALMKDFSHCSLMAARGNSGVILSQFIRGIAKGTKGKDTLTIDDFLIAIKSGVTSAYNSVVKPVEGTMLTVMREACDNTMNNRKLFQGFESCLELFISEMKKSLKRTPNLLPVLKEAGVVDSGGAGLVCIFEGMLMHLRNEDIPLEEINSSTASKTFMSYDPENLLVYGYCTEFILQLQTSKTDLDTFDVNDMISELETLGNSIVAVQDDSLVKVHVHSFEPEKVIGYARSFGELITIKIENMTVQHSDHDAPVKSEPVKYAVVATASGSGIIEYFLNMGVSEVVDGGQTNNPSTEDFVDAFKKINAEHIIVLPNDSNIVMTAMQAAKIYKDSDVRVIKTKSIAEGFSALSMMDLSLDTVEDVISEMTCYLSNVTTGYVTTATRDATINEIAITKNHFIGLTPDVILSDSPDKIEAALSLMSNLPDMDDKQVVTAFCGCDVTQEEKDDLESRLLNLYPMLDIGFIDGNQDVYSFIFAIE